MSQSLMEELKIKLHNLKEEEREVMEDFNVAQEEMILADERLDFLAHLIEELEEKISTLTAQEAS